MRDDWSVIIAIFVFWVVQGIFVLLMLNDSGLGTLPTNTNNTFSSQEQYFNISGADEMEIWQFKNNFKPQLEDSDAFPPVLKWFIAGFNLFIIVLLIFLIYRSIRSGSG
jgi:hypothetical protein